jgi:hypothetical protein
MIAWLNKSKVEFSWRPASALAIVSLASATLLGCNVGKSDTVEAAATETTSTTPTTSTTTSRCAGTYVGGYVMPSHEVRIINRNINLKVRGIPITGNDAIDNAATGGGPPDGGIFLTGSMSFETDATCKVTKGSSLVFGQHLVDIAGTVNADGTFSLTWAKGVGKLVGRVEANNSITGKWYHPAPHDYAYGVLWGTFTPKL